MKITIYVGAHIEAPLEEICLTYYCEKFFPGKERIAARFIGVFLDRASPHQFFFSEENARMWAAHTTKYGFSHPNFQRREIVFKVDMELNTNNEFECTKLLTAKIYKFGELNQIVQLNHDIDFKSSSLEKKHFTCNRSNYHGVFKELLPTYFTFLCGNNRGFTPSNQNNEYKLPQEIAKLICEYVAGHTLVK